MLIGISLILMCVSLIPVGAFIILICMSLSLMCIALIGLSFSGTDWSFYDRYVYVYGIELYVLGIDLYVSALDVVCLVLVCLSL